MASLAEIYQTVVEVEQQQLQKVAKANEGFEIQKVASHYDELGRAMARAYVTDMIKSAMDEAEAPEGAEAAAAEGEESEEAELARRKAEIMAKLKAAQAAEEGEGAAEEAAQMA